MIEPNLEGSISVDSEDDLTRHPSRDQQKLVKQLRCIGYDPSLVADVQTKRLLYGTVRKAFYKMPLSPGTGAM